MNMKPSQLTQLIAAPLASLFLILSLCAFKIFSPEATGEQLILTRLIRDPATDCMDNAIFFNVTEDQSAEVNGRKMPIHKAVSYVSEILTHRAEQVVYLSAAANAPIQDVASAMAQLRRELQDLHFAVVTSTEMKRFLLFHSWVPPKPKFTDEGGCIVGVNTQLFY